MPCLDGFAFPLRCGSRDRGRLVGSSPIGGLPATVCSWCMRLPGQSTSSGWRVCRRCGWGSRCREGWAQRSSAIAGSGGCGRPSVSRSMTCPPALTTSLSCGAACHQRLRRSGACCGSWLRLPCSGGGDDRGRRARRGGSRREASSAGVRAHGGAGSRLGADRGGPRLPTGDQSAPGSTLPLPANLQSVCDRSDSPPWCGAGECEIAASDCPLPSLASRWLRSAVSLLDRVEHAAVGLRKLQAAEDRRVHPGKRCLGGRGVGGGG